MIVPELLYAHAAPVLKEMDKPVRILMDVLTRPAQRMLPALTRRPPGTATVVAAALKVTSAAVLFATLTCSTTVLPYRV